ncbi:MAG: flavodoxin [Clostridia bacterium]|nr:flavodoxin [Clostridia bacterium]
MKKIISVILASLLLFTLAACSQKTENENTTAVSQTGTEIIPESSENTENSTGKKILVIYFSSANTTDVDVVSSATPKAGGAGATGYIANYIHQKVGGDIEKLTPVKDYDTSYNGTLDEAKAERDSDDRPEFKDLSVNPEDYDVIFVGYPMWWYTRPMIIYSFFDKYDFSGKTIIPFNTHEGSGDGGTYDEIKKDEPNATVLDGLAVRGNNAEKSDKEIDSWLSGLEY